MGVPHALKAMGECFGRQGDPWMRVQHQLQQRGPRAGAAEDEHRSRGGELYRNRHDLTLSHPDEPGLGSH